MRLVASVAVTTRPNDFEFVLSDLQSPLARFSASRTELHRTLDLLGRHARAADWNIKTEAGWLEPGQTSVVLN